MRISTSRPSAHGHLRELFYRHCLFHPSRLPCLSCIGTFLYCRLRLVSFRTGRFADRRQSDFMHDVRGAFRGHRRNLFEDAGGGGRGGDAGFFHVQLSLRRVYAHLAVCRGNPQFRHVCARYLRHRALSPVLHGRRHRRNGEIRAPPKRFPRCRMRSIIIFISSIISYLPPFVLQFWA